jgi:hypothetical protein
VSALPENLNNREGSIGGGNTEDLVIMLKNLQGSIVNKIAQSNVKEYSGT